MNKLYNNFLHTQKRQNLFEGKNTQKCTKFTSIVSREYPILGVTHVCLEKKGNEKKRICTLYNMCV